PHHLLARRRTYRHHQPRPALQAPSPRPPLRPLAHPDPQRHRPGNPPHLGRPHADSTQQIQTTDRRHHSPTRSATPRPVGRGRTRHQPYPAHICHRHRTHPTRSVERHRA